MTLKPCFVVFLSVFWVFATARPAQAQAQDDGAFHVSLGIPLSTRVSGAEPAGEIRRGTAVENLDIRFPRDWGSFILDVDYTPANAWGGGIHFTRFSGAGELVGSEPPTSQIFLWGADLDPKIVSSSPIERGPIDYRLSSGWSINRFDGRAIRGWGAGPAYVSVFGGLAYVNIKEAHQERHQRSFLLRNIPPGRPEDPIAIHETYKHDSTVAWNFSGVGPVGGGEITFCPIPWLLLQGKGSLALFFGDIGESGDWAWNKTGGLVPSSQGLRAVPSANIFPPIQVPAGFRESRSVRIIGTELEGSVRARFGGFQIGFGPNLTSYRNVGGLNWAIRPGAAPEKGSWISQRRSLDLLGWVLTVSARF